MKITIQKCEYATIKDQLMANIQSFNSTIDSFLEDHILGSTHYQILADATQIGYCSIYQKSLLTQYYLEPAYRHLGQEVFFQVKRLEYVEKAFVPTCDEFFLSHLLDQYKRLDKQAYFFQDRQTEVAAEKLIPNFVCTQAQKSDLGMIEEQSGDFFDRLAERIEQGEIFIGKVEEQPVAFGIIEQSRLYPAVASIGMFTIPESRGQGFARNMLLGLKVECRQKGIEPIAGCWYYNHNSKKSLESAGMYSQTRLLAIYL